MPSSRLTLNFKDDRCFGVFDPHGEIPRGLQSELGLYCNDTRYLNIWEHRINGQMAVPLAQELRYEGSTWLVSMTNSELPPLDEKDSPIPRDSFLIRKILCLHQDSLFELLTIRNFSTVSRTIQAEHWAGSGFEDLFEVRGLTRAHRGRSLPPSERDPTTPNASHQILSYEGLDGVTRRTHLRKFHFASKIRLSPQILAGFSRHSIQPKEILTLRNHVSFDEGREPLFYGEPFATLEAGEFMKLASEKRRSRIFFDLGIETDHSILNRAIQGARTDLEMLVTHEAGDTSETILYPYAGIPWFSAPFGRDGLISAYQALPWAPHLAQGVLQFAFKTLGSKWDTFTEEEPGKVFHELRRGEMAGTREIPFIPYYGSVDSTPLALILLYEYAAWTRDRASIEEWWPAAMRALDWIDHSASHPEDGFTQYLRRSPKGLINQGWKDSEDSVMHADGSLAQGPIRLCEVQAYVYRAKLGMSVLARWLGQHSLSEKLRRSALGLKARFSAHFWDSARKYVYLALSDQGRPCEVLSSNMGHCLWGGILTANQAVSVSQHLLSETLFSGHGIRTLADQEVAYNPLSYHNGSVWPHDNSLIADGLRLYNQESALVTLAEALLEVLETSEDFRLPELYCGFRKRGFAPPIPYQVACKPQAWAAGSVLLLMKSLLGLSLPLEQNYLTLRSPILTQKINYIRVKGLKVRDSLIDLEFERGPQGTLTRHQRVSGDLRILNVRSRDPAVLD